MDESVLVWGGVAVLVLIAVILYCLWRLLTRASGAPGPGGVTVDAAGRSNPTGVPATADADPELAGCDIEAARGRAQAAARQAAEARERATVSESGGRLAEGSTAGDGLALASSPAPTDPGTHTVDPAVGSVGAAADWAMPAAGVGPAEAGIGPVAGHDPAVPLGTTDSSDSRS